MKKWKGFSSTAKIQVAFLVLGLAVGLLIAMPASWVVRPPQGEPKQPKFTTTLTKEQLAKFIGAPTAVTQPSTKTNGYTVLQYESNARDVNGAPVWGATILVR